MKRVLFVILLLFHFTILFGQQRVIPIYNMGEKEDISFYLYPSDFDKYIYVPFRSVGDNYIKSDTVVVTPSNNWLESGIWGVAFKCDSLAVGSVYDSVALWMKPLLYDGTLSKNDSTFLCFDTPGTNTSNSIDYFSPIPSNRISGVTWYTCVLNGEMSPFAGIAFGIKIVDQTGTARVKCTIEIYKFR